MKARIVILSVITATMAFAHCDSIDGPVVQAARRALAANDVNLVLAWIQPGQESAIRDAFQRSMAVRKLGPDAQGLADRWFFETLVRVHRAGEGAPYEGLKPAGTELDPAIEAADHAIETHKLQDLETRLTAEVRDGLRTRFQKVLKTQQYQPSDVSGGREYVAAYVDFIHFAERLGQALGAGAEHAAEHSH